MKIGQAVILAVILFAFAGVAACTPISTPNPAPVSTDKTVTFVVETADVAGLPTSRKVAITVTAFGQDGKAGANVDPSTGATLPPPVEPVQTPWAHTVHMGHGLTTASITIAFFGLQGEVVKCSVEENGTTVDEQEKPIPGGNPNGGGFVTLTCIY